MPEWRPFHVRVSGKWVLTGEHAVLRGASAIAPQLARKLGIAVVIDELAEKRRLVKFAQVEMRKHRVVQDDYAGMCQRARVNVPMQAIIADVIQRDVAGFRVDHHLAELV